MVLLTSVHSIHNNLQSDSSAAVPTMVADVSASVISAKKQVGSNPNSNAQNMQNFTSKDDVIKLEVLSSLKSLMSHQSFNSVTSLKDLFIRMFPDVTLPASFDWVQTRCHILLNLDTLHISTRRNTAVRSDTGKA
jgi:hypothetical protein